MLVDGQFSDDDFDNLELKEDGSKYLYFEYMSDDNWLFEIRCIIKYSIKSSCGWVERCDHKEECYIKDDNGSKLLGYKVKDKKMAHLLARHF